MSWNFDDKRKTGVISRYFSRMLYGFIRPDDKSKDVFFHLTDLKYNGLKEGDHVSYINDEQPKGSHAREILKL